jgi:DNA (cytosine-5)-methyltransferase 1
MPLVTVSLFSGCGGSDLGAKQAGANVVFANDNDPYAAETYRHHRKTIASDDVDFRDDDVRQLQTFPTCDLLLGCYPCQSFTMGGPRLPGSDPRTNLYAEFARCLRIARPKFFIAENVAGLKWLNKGRHLEDQLEAFLAAGPGYRVTLGMLNARDYGVPADRKRIFMVGVRKDLMAWYHFPRPTHGPASSRKRAYASHGEAIADLPLDATGEYYDYGTEEFSWWYMSRNRKRPWSEPSHAVVANYRHVPLHPASPTLELTESDLKAGSFQRWEFTESYDVPRGQPKLENPRRLSWRECAVLQTFPRNLRPRGPLMHKYAQIGNAVPPRLMKHIVLPLEDESGLSDERPEGASGKRLYRRAA